ncbi:unnamed protein product [Polarella glacialis]|uniref:tRNA/rRNA methyltransferase SpoU type domain-containing protein n=1 Tax=Polarella glacialis TaxID=89957 RepID=A0A813I7L4_POLGL|nr:unnamed protein product [Polarella glacialis]
MAPISPIHGPKAAPKAAPSNVETLVFVDVDGVLNVGVKDSGNAPLLLRSEDIELALRLSKEGYTGVDSECIAKLAEVSTHQIGFGEGEDTYENFTTKGKGEVSAVLAGRLAKLITAAGDNSKVVLSSSWRRPQHAVRKKLLEQQIGTHLNKKDFTFDAKTPLHLAEKSAEDRLRVIGVYLADFFQKRGPEAAPVRILVLEDFFITPMRGWSCGGKSMDSVKVAEQYLESQCTNALGALGEVSIKLVHTYEEWTTAKGKHIEIGCGLREQPFLEAMDYLQATHVVPQELGLEMINDVLLGHESALGKAFPAFGGSEKTNKKANKEDSAGWMKMISGMMPPSKTNPLRGALVFRVFKRLSPPSFKVSAAGALGAWTGQNCQEYSFKALRQFHASHLEREFPFEITGGKPGNAEVKVKAKVDVKVDMPPHCSLMTPAMRTCKAFVQPKGLRALELSNSSGRAERIADDVRKLVVSARAQAGAWEERRQRVQAAVGARQVLVPPLAIVLDGLRSAQNVGSLLRSCAWAGVSEVVLCSITPAPPDPAVLRVAGDAAAMVPIRRAPSASATVEELQREGYEVWAMETTSSAKMLDDVEVPLDRPLALVLGNENEGVSIDALKVCDHHVRIPMRGMKNSLNVAVAGSITIFDVVRRKAEHGRGRSGV